MQAAPEGGWTVRAPLLRLPVEWGLLMLLVVVCSRLALAAAAAVEVDEEEPGHHYHHQKQWECPPLEEEGQREGSCTSSSIY